MPNNPLFEFQTAERKQLKASILIEGLSGSGKSGLALVLANALAKGDSSKVFDIDTENNSVALFAGIKSSSGGNFGGFQIANFTPELGYKPSNYIAFQNAAIENGAEVVINDSISHAWSYEGGVLDILSKLKNSNTRYQRDTYAAWGDPEVVEEKLKLMNLLRNSKCHIISTVRVKEKMEYQTGADGKKELVSLGDQEIMQADIKYEPDLVIHMISPGQATNKGIKHPKGRIVKTRYTIFDKDDIIEFTPEICNQIREYLEEGTSPDELQARQHEEYEKFINETLKANKTKQALWKGLLENAGYKDAKSKDLPLQILKELCITLSQ